MNNQAKIVIGILTIGLVMSFAALFGENKNLSFDASASSESERIIKRPSTIKKWPVRARRHLTKWPHGI